MRKRRITSKAYISLGSNMGNRYENLKGAIQKISLLKGAKVIKLSKIYETQPVGYLEQGKFLNMAMLIETDFTPTILLESLQRIETSMKRERLVHWGPRTIDLDIILYDKLKINLPQLQIPHPEMLNRAFVLVPLKDLKPDLEIYGISIDRYIDACNDKIGVQPFKLDIALEYNNDIINTQKVKAPQGKNIKDINGT